MAVGVDGRRLHGEDVEDDLVVVAQHSGRDGPGHGGGKPAAAEVDVGQDVADDGQARAPG